MTNEVAQIELSIAQAKETIERGAALRRLTANKDFKTVILKGYFEKEPVRLARLKAAPTTGSADSQAGIVRSIDGIGALFQYFSATEMQADMAQGALEDCEEERAALAGEGEL